MNDHSRPSSGRLEAGKSREKLLKSHSQNRYSSTLDKVANSRSQKPSLEKVSSTSIGRKSSLRKRSSSTQQSKTLKFKESKGRTDTSDQERNETAQVNQDRFSNNEQSSDYTDNDDDVPDVRSRTQSSASVKIDSRQETAQEPFRGSKSRSEKRLVRTATPEHDNFSEEEISERDTEDDTLPQLSTKTSAEGKGQNGRRLVSTVGSKLGKDKLMPNPKQPSSKGNTRQDSPVKSRREENVRREDTRQVSPVKSRREENVRREDTRQVSPVKSRREENVRREDTRQVSPVKTRREENVPREDIHDSRSGSSQRQIQESASNLTQKMSRKSASRNQSREEIPGRPGPPFDESDQTKSQQRASGSSKSVNVLASDAPKADKFSEDEISVRDTDTDIDTEGESLSEMSRKTSAVLQGQRERRFGSLVESNQGEETYPKRPSSKDRSRKDSPVKSRREENIRREDTHESRSESSQRQIQEFASNRAPKASVENVSRNQSRQEFPGRPGQPLDESNRKKSQQGSSASSKSVHGFAPPEAPEPDDFSEDEISVRDIDAETDSLPQMSRKTSAELQGQHGRRLGSIFGSQQRKDTLLPNPKQPSSQGSTRQVSPVKSRREENIRREDTHESRSGSNQRQIQESVTNLAQKMSSKNVSRNQSRQDFPGPSGPPLDESSQTKRAPVRETKEVEIPDEPPKSKKVKPKPAGSTKSMIESIPGFPSFTGKETIPPEEPVEPHRLTRETSDALQGQHGPRLKDQFQQYNLESQNIPFQFPVTRSKGKDIPLGKSTTESTLLHAYGVDRGKSQNPVVRNQDPWDVLSEKQEDLRTPSDKYEVSPPRGVLSSEDDRDRMREILPGRSITRTILSGDASPLFPGRGPGQSDWITLNSDVESYRREIERLRNLMLRKEDEADELVKENEVLERRMKTMQSELSARREDTPLAFQAAMKRLEEERDFLQNNLRTSQTRTRELERQLTSLQGLNEETRSLQTRLRDLEIILERAKLDLKDGDTQRLNLEKQIRQLGKDLTESQGDAQRWRQEAQRTRDGLEETERLLTEVQRRQTAALAVPQRDSYDLTQQYQRLATREQSLEREILSLKSGLKALDRDKDDMRIELDRKDERLAKYQSEVEQYKMDLSNLQLRLKNSELQLSHTGETNREQERETIVFRRQTESLRRDLDLVTKERDDSLNQLRKIMKTHSLSEVERRSMSSELDKRNKETDELKKQLQKYIDEVRRIEDLLMRKEEEYDLILDQYRALTAEHSSLESQRNSLEREADTIRREVRETVGQNATLKSKITTQSSLCASYEDEIERLSQQIAALETQLSSLSSAERTLQNESTSTRDLCLKLEANLDKTRLELANSTSAQNRLEAENKQLRAQVETMDAELSVQTENYNRLEELIGKSREKEFSVQRSVQELTVERDEQSRTATLLNARTESLNQEVSKYRLRCTELQAELERARRQLLSEMSERENAVSELRKLQDQLNTSSTNFLLGSSTFTSRDSRSVSPSPQASGGRDIPRLRTTDPGNRIISPLAAMQSHSLSRSFSPDPDLQTDTPLGMSTARGENPSKDQRSTHD